MLLVGQELTGQEVMGAKETLCQNRGVSELR